MKIEYRKDYPQTARTWFAKFPVSQTQPVLDRLERWQLEIAEASVQGTDRDSAIWEIATTPSKEDWHRAQQHRNQPNTMMSVLAGAISKLRSGGDLTEKQLGHVSKIAEIMHIATGCELWEFLPVDQFTKTGNTLQDLQNRLFENA